jgi:glutamate N-acetyltransferase/amino-acid N-acetyltransferase
MQSDETVKIEALPRGFVWGAVRAGIKTSGNLDLAAAVTVKGAMGAAMFTKNQVVAAPVTVGGGI